MEYAHKGASVRFASFITAISRCNLWYAIYEVVRFFGPDSICYCDTDSIYIDLAPVLLEGQYRQMEMDVLKGKRLTLEEFIQITVKQYKHFVEQARIPIITDMTLSCRRAPSSPDQKMKLIDDTTLGAYKIERFVVEAFIIGAKCYLVKCVEVGKGKDPHAISTKMKMKGIPSKDRQEHLFMELFNKLTDNQDQKMPAEFFNIENVFRSCSTGVHISPLLKIICPTLTKRTYSVENNFSMPHEDIAAFVKHRANIALQIKRAKKLKIQENAPIVNNYKKQQSV